MLQKPSLGKLSSIKLEPLSDQLFSERISLPKNAKLAIQSPRFHLHACEDLSMHQTQKLREKVEPTTHRNKLPNLARVAPILKQNLLDLDLYFSRQCPELCQNETAAEMKALLLQRAENMSIQSKRKQTNSTDSQEGSLERIARAEPYEIKKTTDSPFANSKDRKGKSEAKTICRVMKSKKLPFEIRHTSTKPREPSIHIDLDLSVIEKRQEVGLLSAESFQNFFLLPFK